MSRLVLFDATCLDDGTHEGDIDARVKSYLSQHGTLTSVQVIPMRKHNVRAVALFVDAAQRSEPRSAFVPISARQFFLGFGRDDVKLDEHDSADDDDELLHHSIRTLALPPKERQFLISPPPSPPHGWQPRTEDAPVPHPPPFLSTGESAVLFEAQPDTPQVVLEQT
jgi:hypothetical protein